MPTKKNVTKETEDAEERLHRRQRYPARQGYEEWVVNICFQPGGKSDVPTAPEVKK